MSQPFDDRPILNALKVDRGTPVGVSNDGDERGALHTKIKNQDSEPIPIKSINTSVLMNVKWDSFSYQYPSSTQEIVNLYLGGLTGTLKAIITLNYTDTTKNFLLNGTINVL